MFQIQTCTCYVSLFEIKRIQAVVAVHKGLKDWDPLRVNGHLADQKFESRGKLSAKDQSAGVEKIIPLQKELSGGSSGICRFPLGVLEEAAF